MVRLHGSPFPPTLEADDEGTLDDRETVQTKSERARTLFDVVERQIIGLDRCSFRLVHRFTPSDFRSAGNRFNIEPSAFSEARFFSQLITGAPPLDEERGRSNAAISSGCCESQAKARVRSQLWASPRYFSTLETA